VSTRPAPDLVPEALGVPDLRKASELNETPTSKKLVPIEPSKMRIVLVKPYFRRCDNTCARWQQVMTMYSKILSNKVGNPHRPSTPCTCSVYTKTPPNARYIYDTI